MQKFKHAYAKSSYRELVKLAANQYDLRDLVVVPSIEVDPQAAGYDQQALAELESAMVDFCKPKGIGCKLVVE